MAEVTQYRVDMLKEMALRNAKLKQLKGDTSYLKINSGFYQMGESSFNEPVIQLASVSKLVFAYTVARILGDGSAEIPLNAAMLVELVKRSPERLNNLLFNGLGYEITQARIVAGAKSTGLSMLQNRVRNMLESGLLKKEVYLPVEEVFYQAIALSSNSAAAALKYYAGLSEDPQKLSQIYQEYAANYFMLETTENNHHWGEYAPNTGYITEFMSLLHTLITRIDEGKANRLEIVLAQTMANNPVEFKQDFTHTNYGQMLIAGGYTIYEKTGYCPAVTWVEKLLDLGNPTILTLSTIISIKSPKGEIKTFSAFVNFEIAYPWETIEEGGIIFPNDDGPEYRAYIESMINYLNNTFRAMLVIKIEALL